MSESDPSHLRLFIAATSGKLEGECEYLVAHTLPRLRERCRQRNVHFVDLDVRWAAAQAYAHGRSLKDVCADEVLQRHSMFVAILDSTEDELIGAATDSRTSDGPELSGTRVAPWLRNRAGTSVASQVTDLTLSIATSPLKPSGVFIYVRKSGRRPTVSVGPATNKTASSMRLLDRLNEYDAQVRYYTSPASLGKLVLADVVAEMERRYPLDDGPTWLDAERKSHTAFAESRRVAYVPVGDYLSRITEHVTSAGGPLLITGPPGSGRSSLLAQWCSGYRKRHPEAVVVEHYVGASPSGVNLVAILHHILAEAGERDDRAPSIPDTEQELIASLNAMMIRAQSRRLVIVLDGLERLDDAAQRLAWLQDSNIPRRVQVIVSAEGSCAACQTLRSRGWKTIAVHPLTHAQRIEIVMGYLAHVNGRLPGSYVRALTSTRLSAIPRFLRTVLEEWNVRDSSLSFNDLVDQYLSARTLDELFERILGRIETEANGEFDRGIVRRVLTAIWAANRGLSEPEVIALSNAAPEPVKAVIARLGAYIQNQDGLLTFQHDHLRRAVQRRYLRSRQAQSGRYGELARYFAAQPVGPRRVAEEPHAWLGAEDHTQLRMCLANAEFVRAGVENGKGLDIVRYWLKLDELETLPEIYERSFEVWKAGRRRSRADQGHLLRTLGDLHATAGILPAAEQCLRRAIRICNHAEPGERLAMEHRLAEVLRRMGRLRGACVLYETVLTGSHAAGPGHELFLAQVQNDYALALRGLGSIEKAIPLFERAIAVNRALLGVEHPVIAEGLNDLALAHHDAGRLGTALDLYRRSHRIRERWFGESHPLVATSLNNIAGLHCCMENGDLELAETNYRKALAICRNSLGHYHPETIGAVNNLGTLLYLRGRREEAYRILRRTHRTVRMRASFAVTEIVTLEINLAQMLRADGGARSVQHREQAEHLLNSAMASAIEQLGPRASLVATCTHNLAGIAADRREYRYALHLYTQAIEIWQETLGADHEYVGIASASAGRMLEELEDYAESLDALKRALAILRRVLGPGHQRVLRLEQRRDAVRRRITSHRATRASQQSTFG